MGTLRKTAEGSGLAESLIKVVDDIPMLYGSLVGSKLPKKPKKDNGQPPAPKIQKVAEDLSAEALPSELSRLRKALEKAAKGNRASRKQILALVRSWGSDRQVPPHLVGLDPMSYTEADRQAILDIVGGKRQYAPKLDKLVTYDPKAPVPSLEVPKIPEVKVAPSLGKTIAKVFGAAAAAGVLGYGAYRLLRKPQASKAAAAKPKRDSDKPLKKGPELAETKKGPEPVNWATGN